MSLIDEFIVQETRRDRYSRESQLSSNIAKIKTPCHGIGLRNKKDLHTFKQLRLNFPTERLGFCIVQLANSDDTFVDLSKRIKEEKYKLSPTAEGTQLKMFVNQTILAVEPSTQFTYYYDKDMINKILTSMETPTFLKEFVTSLKKKVEKCGSAKSEEYQQWKNSFFEKTWLELLSNNKLRNKLVTENYDGQKTSNASILIPPTPPLVSDSMLQVAIKIIEDTTKLAKNSTAIYFNLPLYILKNTDLIKKKLDYCKSAKNPIIILKIRDLDQILDPDKEDERVAFSEIQEALCEIRKNNQNRCTILLEGGKLTIPSLVRGFDIVTNHISGKNEKKGGKPRKGSTDPIGYSQYFIKEKLIFYQYKKMIEYAENQLKLTHNEHGLRCKLPCCSDVKSLKGINKEIWNTSITRPHFALTMNDIAIEIARLIHTNQIQKAKEIILKSELCVLKHLIPDV